jgi:L-2-hydroxyglutarate oxidase LhgO
LRFRLSTSSSAGAGQWAHHGLRRIDSGEIRQLEPGAAGIDALHVPEAGVVDFPALAGHLSASLRSAGASVLTGHEVTVIDHETGGVAITAGPERFRTRTLVNCAGLHSDRVAALAGVESAIRIIPFRGEYYRLAERAADLVTGLIYPVPDPRFPFLGVHFTRRIDDVVEVRPTPCWPWGEQYGVGRCSPT